MQPKVVIPPIECVPILEIHKEMVSIPPALTAIHPNPVVPSSGDNAALLDWAQACASNARMYKLQMDQLRNLK
jgi:hypothetical protein